MTGEVWFCFVCVSGLGLCRGRSRGVCSAQTLCVSLGLLEPPHLQAQVTTCGSASCPRPPAAESFPVISEEKPHVMLEQILSQLQRHWWGGHVGLAGAGKLTPPSHKAAAHVAHKERQGMPAEEQG